MRLASIFLASALPLAFPQAGFGATLLWNPVAGASGYQVFQATFSLLSETTSQATLDSAVTKAGVAAPTASYAATGLALGATYYFRVAAYDSSGALSAFNVDAVTGLGVEISTDLVSAAPAVSMTSPPDQAIVSGSVVLSAAASTGTVSVQFLLDGTALGAPVMQPFTTLWNAGLSSNGVHTLSARAIDSQGRQATSQAITVRVTGSVAADATVPGLRGSYAFPNPALRGQTPVIRASLGLVDSVEITIFDIAGQAVHSTSLPSTPSGVTDEGEYYYDHPWTGAVASGVYFYIVHGKTGNGEVIRARGRFAVLR